MRPGEQGCDNPTCPDSRRVGAGNIKVFSCVERRYYCATCRRTFSEDRHTFFETLRCPRATVLEALSLLVVLVERNSLRAAARLAHHSPNRVLHWLALAGQHGSAVGSAMIRDLAVTQVQVDELWTFVKKSKPTATRVTPTISATPVSGEPWPCPAGSAWPATSAMNAAMPRHARFSPNSRLAPMGGRRSSPATNCPPTSLRRSPTTARRSLPRPNAARGAPARSRDAWWTRACATPGSRSGEKEGAWSRSDARSSSAPRAS